MAGKYWTKPWNPIVGTDGKPHCTKVSPGCLNCWASSMNHRFGGGDYNYQDEDFEFMVKHDVIDKPFRARKPQIYFVMNNMDLFHPSVGYDLLHYPFNLFCAKTVKKHKFLLLTKRPERMLDYYELWQDQILKHLPLDAWDHLWWGVSVENQETAEERIPILLEIPGNKWLSIEPMLGPVDPSKWIDKIDWMTAGCETGPKRRKSERLWFDDLVECCLGAEIPFWLKQYENDDGQIVDYPHSPFNGLPKGFAEILYR